MGTPGILNHCCISKMRQQQQQTTENASVFWFLGQELTWQPKAWGLLSSHSKGRCWLSARGLESRELKRFQRRTWQLDSKTENSLSVTIWNRNRAAQSYWIQLRPCWAAITPHNCMLLQSFKCSKAVHALLCKTLQKCKSVTTDQLLPVSQWPDQPWELSFSPLTLPGCALWLYLGHSFDSLCSLSSAHPVSCGKAQILLVHLQHGTDQGLGSYYSTFTALHADCTQIKPLPPSPWLFHKGFNSSICFWKNISIHQCLSPAQDQWLFLSSNVIQRASLPPTSQFWHEPNAPFILRWPGGQFWSGLLILSWKSRCQHMGKKVGWGLASCWSCTPPDPKLHLWLLSCGLQWEYSKAGIQLLPC